MCAMSVNLDEIATAWIARYQSEEGSEFYESSFWVYELVSYLCEGEPETCLDVICEILEQTDDSLVLANLAAGPLEDLLVKNGLKVIDRIKLKAKEDKNFQKLLGAVWRNDISNPVWREIKAIAGPSW